ncbi:MAG TPA: hypothetical protein VJA26_18290 [Gammaproteobacteria bacterium]|nr:hypothetical protein [Gammaproteobacteria bacterium]
MTPSRQSFAAWLGLLIQLGAAAAAAQEGFPLDGTWRGEWGPPGGDRTAIVIVMQWDGKNIKGLINPGRSSAPFAVAELNPRDWSVHIEARLPTASGEAVPVAIDGKLEDLGSYHRTITGTWTAAGVQSQFMIRRE